MFAVKKIHILFRSLFVVSRNNIAAEVSVECVISRTKLVFVCHSTHPMVMSDNEPQFNY